MTSIFRLLSARYFLMGGKMGVWPLCYIDAALAGSSFVLAREPAIRVVGTLFCPTQHFSMAKKIIFPTKRDTKILYKLPRVGSNHQPLDRL